MTTLERIRAAIITAVERRGPKKSVCPSEVARALWPKNWRVHMDDVRTAAAALVREGRVRATQRGQEIDLAAVKGPIRLSTTSAEDRATKS